MIQLTRRDGCENYYIYKMHLPYQILQIPKSSTSPNTKPRHIPKPPPMTSHQSPLNDPPRSAPNTPQTTPKHSPHNASAGHFENPKRNVKFPHSNESKNDLLAAPLSIIVSSTARLWLVGNGCERSTTSYTVGQHGWLKSRFENLIKLILLLSYS